VILGELEATSGHVTRNGRLRMGRFSQHHVDQLELDKTPLEAFQKEYPNSKPMEIRAHLGSMGLGGNLALQKMRTLSGGQKSRVAFAQIMWQARSSPAHQLISACGRRAHHQLISSSAHVAGALITRWQARSSPAHQLISASGRRALAWWGGRLGAECAAAHGSCLTAHG
jgi:hypothetical protein